MNTKLKGRALLVGLLATAVYGQTAPYTLLPHSDSQYARELLRLKQIDLMQSQLAGARGTAAENLWKAQLLQAQYDDLIKDAASASTVTQDYLAALAAYIKSQDKGLDGAWALDHAQFILSHLSQPILTRMEYFSNNRKDRDALAPLAASAEELLRVAGRSLDASMKQIESAKPFDDKAYAGAYAAAAEARYYTAWSEYFSAMALDPAAPPRKSLLAQAVEGLAEWAVDQPDNGVNYQSYLLRGKAQSEAGDPAKALADFAKAQSDKAPNWVQYQARYQTVVVHLRAGGAGGAGGGGDFAKAQADLDTFKQWIPKDNGEALISADMLGYRVAWAVALAKTDATERRRAQRDALDSLAAVIRRDPRFRDLVYEQLAAQIPENADVAALFPMQQLALAYAFSQDQKGDTPASRRQLALALTAAAAARANPQSLNSDKLEAAFLQGVCNALLGNLAEAAGIEVDFATLSPQDPRARQMVDLALQQIGELRKAATLTPALRALAAKALDLSTNTFRDKQWLYAQARLLEESNKPAEAAAIYSQIAADDRNYLDARYRLVALATERFSGLETQAPPASAADQKKAAGELFAACATFIGLLDHPPASAPRETLQAAQGYRYNIWLIETAAALAPAVRNIPVALDRLALLDAAGDKLTEPQRGTVQRYRIQAYALAGQGDKSRQVLNEYGKTGADALASIRGMALAGADEIDKSTDPAEIRRLAGYVVMLLDPIIAAEGKQDSAFEYRLIQADMMVRAGQLKEAQALAVSLQNEKKEDIRPFMTEARGMFGQAQAGSDLGLYAKSQDYFTRILARLSPGSEAFWESWLRIIQSMEAQSVNPAAEIKAHLGDLKVIYGTKYGGDRFHDDFAKLAAKYGMP